MAATGYQRQSTSAIQDGQQISAPPLDAEFDAIQAAFDVGSGHDHSGSVPGDGQKISLTTAIVGILPLANGGLGVNAATTTVTLPQALVLSSTLNVTGAVVGSSTINAVGGLLDNSNRAVSASNKFAIISTTPANPANTASVPGVMAGLAQIITPTVTGRILITVCGVDGIAATTTTGAVTLRFGTGAPPGNGTALTGTVISNTISFANNTAVALSFPFSVTGIATGLTLGVPIWIDLAQSVSALTGITVTATEI